VLGESSKALNTERPNILATTHFYILAKAAESDRGQRLWLASGRPSFARSKAEAEPEARLWKVCAEAASPLLSGFEWIAFLLFGALALGTLAFCFSELFRLLHGGVLDETVRALLIAIPDQPSRRCQVASKSTTRVMPTFIASTIAWSPGTE
jgi:hypothetical protein